MALNASVILASGAVEAIGNQLPVHIADQAPPRTADWEHKAPLYFRDNEGVDVSPTSSTDPAMT